ncbi:Macrolide glycosyltransferase [Alloactinosynnema sp. L-07]|uniref:nucleotide disphospho-sugar-binding domain-containing protein n=1 Tax=Alloactinosynnema sp. L-07 TaxID=1653480 RepID=UPI00065EF44B|nr:nucleotide disphospho-sugar-binding domain-containing protein [Alloactinosynnema sp. L-07]CRK61969.1 Macrolide glycosyltransferase [Alloactinosynnema sp. L-07]
MNVLYASIPAWGHTYPVLPGLAELGGRGHRVQMLASASFAAEIARCAEPVGYDSPMDMPDDPVDLADMGRVLPLLLAEARAAYAALAAVRRPDVIVADVLSMAGWLLAEATGLPLVRVWPVFASNSEFSLHTDYASRTDDAESTAGFLSDVADFIADVGLSARPSVSPERFFSNEADHNIALYPRELQPRGDTFDERFTFVRPCIRPPEESADLPWLRGDGPLAAVSLGTVFTGNTAFFRTCVAGVDQLGWRAAVAVGPTLSRSDIGPVSDKVMLRGRLPMIDTLRNAAVLVSHGGLTSTVEALAHGVPVVIAPQIGEQRAVADQVEALGVGVRLREPFTPATVAEQLRTVAADPLLADRVAGLRARITGGRPGAEFADAVEHALA